MVYAGGTKLSSHPAEKEEEEKTAETSLCWLAGHSLVINWSSWCSAGWSAGLPDWPAKVIKTVLKPMYKSAKS